MQVMQSKGNEKLLVIPPYKQWCEIVNPNARKKYSFYL